MTARVHVGTILEAAHITASDYVDGIRQKPIEGVSMLYTFNKANAIAPSVHLRATKLWATSRSEVSCESNCASAPSSPRRIHAARAAIAVLGRPGKELPLLAPQVRGICLRSTGGNTHRPVPFPLLGSLAGLGRHGHAGRDCGSSARLRFHGKSAVDQMDALLHAHQS